MSISLRSEISLAQQNLLQEITSDQRIAKKGGEGKEPTVEEKGEGNDLG